MKTLNMRVVAYAVSVAALVMAAPHSAFTQSPQSASESRPENGRRNDLRQAISEIKSKMVAVTGRVQTTIEALDKAAQGTPESRQTEVKAFRSELVDLGVQLQVGSPLQERISRFEGWVSAQMDRVQKQRAMLGNQFVDDVIASYKEDLTAVAAAKEQLKTYSDGLNGILTQLSMAELRASELLLVADSKVAVAELTKTLRTIGELLEQARQVVRDVGAPPAQGNLLSNTNRG